MRRFPPPEEARKPTKRTRGLTPYTVAEFNAEFRTNDLCLEYIKEQRWPGAVTECLKCGNRRKHHRVTARTAYACGDCGKQIYPLAGTTFAKSRMPLKKWFYAIYLMGSTDCTMTAKQLQREIGVTYKTAWRVSRSIRQLMASESPRKESSAPEFGEISKSNGHTVEPRHSGTPPLVQAEPCETKTAPIDAFASPAIA